MNHQRKYTSNNKIIDVYDNVFSQSQREYHIQFAYQSKYLLKSAFGSDFWVKDKNIFLSSFDPDDLNNFNFLNQTSFDPIAKQLENYEINNCYIQISSLASNFFYHVDYTNIGGKTLLYYVNSRWDRNWGGETLFANEHGECEIAVEYKPGRIVIFDADIEHKASNSRTDSDEFRCVFVIHYRT